MFHLNCRRSLEHTPRKNIDRVAFPDEYEMYHAFPIREESKHIFIMRLCPCSPGIDVYDEGYVVIVHNRFA